MPRATDLRADRDGGKCGGRNPSGGRRHRACVRSSHRCRRLPRSRRACRAPSPARRHARAGKCAVAAEHRRGERSARRGDDPCGESGVAKAVVDDCGEICIERCGALRLDRRARDHMQKIGCGCERRIRRNQRLAGTGANERRDRHRKRRQNRRRIGIVGQRRKRDTHALNERPERRARQPLAVRANAFARAVRALPAWMPASGHGRRSPPTSPPPRLHIRRRRRVFRWLTAHPDRAAVAVGVAEHRLRRDHTFQPAVHAPRLRMSPTLPYRSDDCLQRTACAGLYLDPDERLNHEVQFAIHSWNPGL